jgi:heat shock protein HtpX
VTRGLIEKLPQRELEAVLAHELTHILNRDSRVMTMASVLAGVFEKLVHDAWRLLSLPFSGSKRRMMALPWMIMPLLLAASALPPLLFFWGLVAVSRASLSRAREFLADAGAVELTKDPDALISALRRIASSDEIVDAPAAMQAMMIFGRFAGLMATHPPLEERIEALRQHAGAYNPEPITREIRAAAVGAGARTFGRRKMAGPPRLQRG